MDEKNIKEAEGNNPDIQFADEPNTEIATASLKSFLTHGATRNYEPGFTKIDINKTGTFSSESFGNEETITALIIAIEPTRALYPWGTEEEEKVITEWLEREKVPLCSARGDDCLLGRGKIFKVLDDTAPTLVRTVIEPIITAEFKCVAGQDRGCPWSTYGSDGAGMACKENRRLLLWNPASGVYGVLTVTSTSLKGLAHYLNGVPNRDFTSVLTTFGLDKQAKGKYKWCTLNFHVTGEITNNLIAPLAKMVKYQGQDMMEAQAVTMGFLRIEMDIDMDLPEQPDGLQSAGEDVADDF